MLKKTSMKKGAKGIIWIGVSAIVVAILLFGLRYTIRPIVLGEIKTVKALNMNLSDLRMELTFEVENPNFFPVNISDFSFDVWLNEAYIGKVRPLEKVKLKAGLKDYITVQVKAEYKGNIFEGFLIALETFNNERANYKATGFVKVEALYIEKEFSIHKSGTAEILQPENKELE